MLRKWPFLWLTSTATVVLVMSLFAPHSKAEDGETISMPALITPATSDVNPITGAFTERLPIEVPSTRPALGLALSYSTGQQSSPWLDGGWTMPLASIQRSWRSGAPQSLPASATAEFSANLWGEQVELVKVGPTSYRARDERVYRAFEFQGASGWQVILADGTKLYLGNTSSSVVNGINANGVNWAVEWYVDRVVDRYGNTVSITWSQSFGTPYPMRVAWENVSVDMTYVARHIRPTTLRWGAKHLNTSLLSTLSVKVQGQLVRKYVLGYQNLPGESLLKTVALVSATEAVSRNIREYSYTDESRSPLQNGRFADSEAMDILWRDRKYSFYADINGDSFADVVTSQAPPAADLQVLLSDGRANIRKSDAYTNSVRAAGLSLSVAGKPNFVFADLNGDMLTDVIRATGSTSVVFLNSGAAFHKSDSLSSAVAAAGVTTGWRVGDINGDGKSDLISSTAVHLSTGTTLAVNSLFAGSLQSGRFVDLNGDRIADIIQNASGDQKKIYLGTGSGWIADATLTNAYNENPVAAMAACTTSMNSDGVIDSSHLGTSYLSTGDGWVKDTSVLDARIAWEEFTNNPTMHLFYFRPGETRPPANADMDGDGICEDIYDGSWQSFRRAAPRSLLYSIKTLAGETTTVQYEWASKMRGPYSRAKTLTRSGVNMNTIAYNYTYGNPQFDAGEFVGYASTVIDLPTGGQRVLNYYPDRARAGLAYVDFRYQASPERRAGLLSIYEVVTLTSPAMTQVRKTSQTVYTQEQGNTVTQSQTSFAYDNYLNPTRIAEGNETVRLLTYATGGQVRNLISTAVTKNAAETTTLERSETYYDGQPLGLQTVGKISETREFFTPTSYLATRYTVDAYGNIIAITDPDGGVTAITYDPVLRTLATRITDPLGIRDVSSTYDYRFSVPLTETNANREVTSYEYDDFGRLLKETRPGDECKPNGSRMYTYGRVGGANSITMTEGTDSQNTRSTTAVYDSMGRVSKKSVTSPGPYEAVFVYDADDHIISKKEQAFGSNPTVWNYDMFGRITSIIQPSGARSTFSYSGLTTTVVDEAGNTVQRISDSRGRLVKLVEIEGGRSFTTNYRLDAMGRVERITDPNGAFAQIYFDMMGRRTQITDPIRGTVVFGYDSRGLNTSVTHGNRSLVTTFNRSGMVTSRVATLAGQPTLTVGITYGTDASLHERGRPIHIEDQAGALDLFYDGRGRVVERQRTVSSLGKTFVVGYGYDSVDNLRQLMYPDGTVINYAFDANLALSSVKVGSASVYTVGARDSYGRVRTATLGNGLQQNMTFDSFGRLSQKTLGTSTGVIDNLTFAFDVMDRIATIRDNVAGSAIGYSYNARGMLTNEKSLSSVPFEYDAAGNLVRKGGFAYASNPAKAGQVQCAIDLGLASKSVNGIGNVPALWNCVTQLLSSVSNLSTEARDKLTKIQNSTSASSSDTGVSQEVAYDIYGNQTKRGRFTYEYDAENRLSKIRGASGEILETNLYDASGERVVRTLPTGTTVYVDGIHELHIGSGTGATFTTNHVTAARKTIGSMRKTGLPASMPTESSVANIGFCGGATASVDTLGEQLKDAYLLATAKPVFESPWSQGYLRSARTTLRVVCGFALLLLGLTLTWLTRRRSRLIMGLRQGLSSTLHQLGAQIEAARRRPLRFALAWSLVLATLTGAGCAPHALDGIEDSIEANELALVAGDMFYYENLPSGTVRLVTNAVGTIVQRNPLSGFGDATPPTTDGNVNSFDRSLDGRTYDGTAGVYYFGARHYDPVLGRFMSADTMLEDGSGVGLNRYAFNRNDPINNTDPSGNRSIWGKIKDGFESVGNWIGGSAKSAFDWFAGAAGSVWDWASANWQKIVITVAVVVVAVVLTIVTYNPSAGMMVLAWAGIGGAAGIAVGGVLYAAGAIDGQGWTDIALAGFMLGASVGAAAAGSMYGLSANQYAPFLAKTGTRAWVYGTAGGTGGLIFGTIKQDKIFENFAYGFAGGFVAGTIGGARASWGLLEETSLYPVIQIVTAGVKIVTEVAVGVYGAVKFTKRKTYQELADGKLSF